MPEKKRTSRSKPSTLVVIGGAEDRTDEKTILSRVLKESGNGESELLVVSCASSDKERVEEIYARAFAVLGARHVSVLNVDRREDANSKQNAERILRARGVFLTGGQQERLMSVLGGTEVETAIHRVLREKRACVAGTSAGAAAMSEHMIASPVSNEPQAVKGMVGTAAGLGFLKRIVIDSHFSERGRLNRLLSVVAQNPYLLGVGIDENTALVVDCDAGAEVIGQGTVTVLDARAMTSSNIAEAEHGELLAMSGVQLHLLPAGFAYRLDEGIPSHPGPADKSTGLYHVIRLLTATVDEPAI